VRLWNGVDAAVETVRQWREVIAVACVLQLRQWGVQCGVSAAVERSGVALERQWNGVSVAVDLSQCASGVELVFFVYVVVVACMV
jgi:hypothetical protein